MEINDCNRNDLAPSTVKINIECLQNKLQGEKRERETRGTSQNPGANLFQIQLFFFISINKEISNKILMNLLNDIIKNIVVIFLFNI